MTLFIVFRNRYHFRFVDHTIKLPPNGYRWDKANATKVIDLFLVTSRRASTKNTSIPILEADKWLSNCVVFTVSVHIVEVSIRSSSGVRH